MFSLRMACDLDEIRLDYVVAEVLLALPIDISCNISSTELIQISVESTRVTTPFSSPIEIFFLLSSDKRSFTF